VRSNISASSVLVAVDDEALREFDLVVRQRPAFRFLHRHDHRRRRLGRGHTDALPAFDTVAGLCALAIQPQLAGARPFRDGGEAGVGQMPLEPAVESDAVVVLAHGELADTVAVVLAHTSAFPTKSAATETTTEAVT
jgi:hypothetical protein